MENNQPKNLENKPAEPAYPEVIRESQGDRADQAEIEIEQDILEGILKARQSLAKR